MKYGITLVTDAAVPVVTLAEAKKQIGIAQDNNEDNDELERIVESATKYVQGQTSRQIINATYDLKLDRFPYGCDSVIYVPKSPLSSVTSITYTDSNGVSQTLATSVYKVIASREPGEIRLKYGQSWPTVYGESEVVTVRFVAGYGSSASSVPKDLKHAILLLVSHWFTNKEAVLIGSISKEIEFSLNALLQAYLVGDEFHVYAT